jgi:hypothetical protein
MSTDSFEVLGTKILTHLGDRKADFHYLVQLIQLQCTALTELSAFLILEEIATLIQEIEDVKAIVQLKKVEHALHEQVYREFRAVAMTC